MWQGNCSFVIELKVVKLDGWSEISAKPSIKTQVVPYVSFPNESAVVFYSHYRNEDNSGYHLHFSPALQNYPTGDQERDAITVNQIVEEAIRKQPDQYLWLHKRFKTQAHGKSERPY